MSNNGASRGSIILSPGFRPSVQGPAHCIACHHEWTAVAKAGEWWFHCPSCGTNKGTMIFHAAPTEGAKRWTCACGCQVFYLTPQGPFCPNCGNWQHT